MTKKSGNCEDPEEGHQASESVYKVFSAIDRRKFGQLLVGASGVAFMSAQPVFGSSINSNLDASMSTLTLKSGNTVFRIDTKGVLREVIANEKNYLASIPASPLLSLQVGGQLYAPSHASWNQAKTLLRLRYDAVHGTALVRMHEKDTHIVFDVLEAQAVQPVELVLWGPYATNIHDLVGEVVGVVRNTDFAIGIQVLNCKTLGGYPLHASDIQPNFYADDPGYYAGYPPELNKNQFWRADTAKVTSFGSTLQAYCRDRDHVRYITNWGYKDFKVLPYDDGGVIGSSIALFACPAEQVLPTIGEIELAEGLPHPLLDGKWAKMQYHATASYLIVDFGEETIDEGIRMAQKAGMKYLYQSSPFATWGHFKLKPELFPNGWNGYRTCVEKARKAGIGLGFHVLSNFITPNDPYVTPVPDPRLARTGTSMLSEKIDAAQIMIPIASPQFFEKKTTLNTVAIDEELIQYEGISKEPPWYLLKCKRGAWGTKAAVHVNGSCVGKLMDYPYGVFLADASLAREMAQTVAAFCAHTGAKQLSFDGLEGNYSTGMGQYGCSLFTDAWFKALPSEMRGRIINDASNPHPFAWHIASRYNWGEPWWGKFEQSETLYRLKNQLFFKRNLLPNMLGWFAINKDTTLADIEWMCALAAGYDAGFALATSFESQAKLSTGSMTAVDQAMEAMLAVVAEWETARQTGAFPEHIKEQLRDVTRRFRLTSVGAGQWDVHQLLPAGLTIRINANPRMLEEWAKYNGALA